MLWVGIPEGEALDIWKQALDELLLWEQFSKLYFAGGDENVIQGFIDGLPLTYWLTLVKDRRIFSPKNPVWYICPTP